MDVKQDSVTNEIAQIRSLPPFPLLSNILKSFIEADESGDLRMLISYIEFEPAIAAKVIGTSNSAFYNTGGTKIQSIRAASVRLGLNQLKTIVYSLVIAQRFNTKKCPGFNMSRYWYDTMFFAHCARHVANNVNIPGVDTDSNQVYCIALLFRIGLLALIHLYPDEMHHLLTNELDKTLCVKERLSFSNLDHFDVGALLLRQWALPEEYSHCLTFAKQSNYTGENCEMVRILQRTTSIIDEEAPAWNEDTDGPLGLSEKALETILSALENDKVWISEFASLLH